MNVYVNSVNRGKGDMEKLFSTRTVLYNLQPEGIGTPYTESLSSYIARIAAIHNVSTATLLKEILEPVLTTNHIKQELLKGNNKSTLLYINENNSITFDYVKALELLTGREDLRNLTMLNWQGILCRNIMGDNRKWCPACFNQMLADSKTIYEPLIWYLNAIEKCDIHQISLRDKCKKCKKKLPFIHSQLIVGYCQYCGGWLGEEVNDLEASLNDMEKFVVLNYKQLIENTPRLKWFPSKRFISLFFRRLISEYGFSSYRSLANFFEINTPTMNNYIYGLTIPNPDFLIKIASKLNSTIYKTIYNENIEIEINVKEFNFSKGENTPLSIIESQLKGNLKLDKPKSLSKIARSTGFSIETARRHFPNLCSSVEENYLAYQEKRKTEAQTEIERILTKCLSRDIPTSLTKLAEENGISIKKIRRYFPDLSKKVSLRYNSYLSEIKKRKIDFNLKEIQRVSDDLHQKGIYPSTQKVRQALDDKNVFLYKELMDGWKEKITQLGYKSRK